MKLANAHSFTNAEENLIKKAILFWARTFEDENGNTDHLAYAEKKVYNDLVQIYHNF